MQKEMSSSKWRVEVSKIGFNNKLVKISRPTFKQARSGGGGGGGGLLFLVMCLSQSIELEGAIH